MGTPWHPFPGARKRKAGGDLTDLVPFSTTPSKPKQPTPKSTFISTANKEKDMAAIDEIPDVTSTFHPVRTGVAVMVAGVATGTVLYVVSVVVAGWA